MWALDAESVAAALSRLRRRSIRQIVDNITGLQVSIVERLEEGALVILVDSLLGQHSLNRRCGKSSGLAEVDLVLDVAPVQILACHQVRKVLDLKGCQLPGLGTGSKGECRSDGMSVSAVAKAFSWLAERTGNTKAIELWRLNLG